MASRGVNSPVTSSAGRLFDAVAAILGVRDEINYEGQAAVELEQLADPAERGAYRAAITTDGARKRAEGAGAAGGPLLIAGRDLVRAVVDDLAAGTSTNVIAARFHNGVAGLITQACVLLRERHGLNDVALSGGVFQNLLLLHAAVGKPGEHGFRVLVHSRVPCNDGGISLGQAVIAAAVDRRDAARRQPLDPATAEVLLVRRRGGPAAQPVVPLLHAGPGGGRQLQHQRVRADLPDVGRVPPGVEVHVGQQVVLAHQDQVGLAEHMRVLHRLVVALGDRGQHHPGLLAQVEQGRADQVADVLDHDQRPAGRVEQAQPLGHHLGVEVTACPGVDLHHLAARGADAPGVQRRGLVTLDDRDGHLAAQLPRGAFEQCGLSRAGRAHQVDG